MPIILKITDLYIPTAMKRLRNGIGERINDSGRSN